ncbi:protein of unknown function DUF664 [Agrococcus casei LMG 22410]|uniref:Mini-circle protein n=1 Tax=Agrococcus casei LMG 22410 TaxID=1255656 RepID=A0A1R4GGG5_9MICO|nr:protein of unknown function DUF664 [Agrococcus casei LMG 22410]
MGQLVTFIEQHRAMIASALDGLTEDEARLKLVPSKTTLLGLAKHAVFVERVWFEEAFDGLPRSESGLVAGPDESFDLAPEDSIDSIRAEFEAAVARSRARCRGMGADDVVTGNRRGPLPLRWILMHVLREHAQHCGHIDVLREIIIARRTAGAA